MQDLIQEIYDPNDPATKEFALFAQPWNAFSDLAFWLRIMRDHMMFINRRTARTEFQLLDVTTQLYERGLQLGTVAFNAARNGNTDINALNNDSIGYLTQVRTTKQNVLDRLLNGTIITKVQPTLVSHMLNELQSAWFFMQGLKMTGELPPPILMNHHELWVSDMIGHLDAVMKDLDGVEKMLKKRVKHEKKEFEKIHMKILEFINYIKHGVTEFPALQKLTASSVIETMLYLRLLKEIHDMAVQKTAIGSLDTDFLLHMIIEEIYYLVKLEQAQPGFDPLKSYPIIIPQTVKIITQ